MLTFLIADVRGYTAYTHQHGDAAAAVLAGHFASLAGEAVGAQDGQVVEVRGDEVMAVFTSARNALRAAVSLLSRCAADASPSLPLRAGVGLDVGEPISVPDGYRGEVINVAARLCAKAGPGEVLASDAVVSLARRIEGLLYEERGNLELKGIPRPVSAWLVRAAPDGEQPASAAQPAAAPARSRALPHGGYLGAIPDNTLVSRASELDRIEGAIAAAAAGTGRLVLLAGEPGVGKTRLAQEAMLAAQGAGLRVLVGRCYEEQTSVPFLPFTEALSAAWDLASPALRLIAASRYGELGRLLPERLAATPLPEGEDPRQRVLRAVAGFLQALAAEVPLALLVDDLHWADSPSLELLSHLARSLRADPVLLLGTYRDVEVGRQHPLEHTLNSLTRDRVVEVLTLRGLPPAGTADLICARFGVTEVSNSLRDLVHARTEGNPFFTEEVLSALVEQGAIYREGAAWERKEMAEITVPQSVRSVVGQRVGRLASEAQETLRMASVLGQEWDLDLLLEAAGQDEDAVLDHLEAALVARLLEERRGGRRERFAFAHALIAQTLYDEVPRFRLRRLHLRTGEALERARGERPESAAELSRHFLAGGDETRALRYAIAAGDHAESLYAHAEAQAHFEAALELLQDMDRELETAAVRRKLGAVLVNMGRTGAAVASYEAARAVYEQAGDRAALAELEREIGWAYQVASEFAAAAPHLEAALRLWPAGQEDAALVRLLLDAARIEVFTGELDAARQHVDHSVALAEQLGDVALQARGLVETALLAMKNDIPDRVLALLDQAEPLARRGGDRVTLSRLFNNRGTVHYSLGEFRLAAEDYGRAAALADELGMPGSVAFFYANVAWAYLELGEWEAGRAAARSGLAAGIPETWVLSVILARMEGDLAQSFERAHELLDDARRRADTQGQMSACYYLAYYHLDFHQAEDALSMLRQAMAADGSLADDVFVHVFFAEAAAHAGAPDASALLERVTARVEREQVHIATPLVLRARGLLLHHQGDDVGAMAALQESAAEARRQECVLHLARTLFVVADVARANGDEAVAAAADAERVAIIERIGPEVRGLVWSM
jgi:class 3 adenylate cyclase/tetratricopeptide (TPR) repeat protein